MTNVGDNKGGLSWYICVPVVHSGSVCMCNVSVMHAGVIKLVKDSLRDRGRQRYPIKHPDTKVMPNFTLNWVN